MEAVKKNSVAAYYLRIVGTLLLITAAVALLLSLVDLVTRPIILRRAEEKRAAAMGQVLPGDGLVYSAVPLTGDGVLDANAAFRGDQLMGYCVQVQVNGFGGAMELMVGVDANGAVTGVSILSHGETAGTNQHGWLTGQFVGKSGQLAVSKNDSVGQNIQAISGATVSSKAVTRGVNSALQAVEAYQKGGAQ